MKLKTKLSFASIGGVVVTTLVAGAFAHMVAKHINEQTWEARFQDYTDALALPLSRAVSDNDLVLADAYAFDLKTRASLFIDSIRVLDVDGAVLVSASADQTHAGDPAVPAYHNEDLVSFSTPLAWNGQQVGLLSVSFERTPVDRSLEQMDTVILAIAVVGSLLSALASVWLSKRLLSPLTTLAAQLATLSEEAPAELTRVQESDEIGTITNAFIQAYDELRKRSLHNREMVLKLEKLTQQLSDELEVNAALCARLTEENKALNQRVRESGPTTMVIGEDGDLQAIVERARQAAQSKLTVLLSGESGTGKEVIARTIHQTSERHDRNFIVVNCAALPENLIESELFGHERGSFTGATERKVGKFLAADGGTIFLDEIGELPLAMQPKLLRVLEARQVDRVGATRPTPVDVRVIAASNRDLEIEVAKGRFREDLYFRLKVIHIHLPPLRERPRDLAALAAAFVVEVAAEMGLPTPVLPPATLDLLRAYSWPGNIRELRHILAAALSQHPVVVLKPEHVQSVLPRSAGEALARSGGSAGDTLLEANLGLDTVLDACEKRVLETERARRSTQKEMARHLKLSEARLHRLLKKHGLLARGPDSGAKKGAGDEPESGPGEPSR